VADGGFIVTKLVTAAECGSSALKARAKKWLNIAQNAEALEECSYQT
jgi:hypothetical protein